jgi:hypothetical protein
MCTLKILRATFYRKLAFHFQALRGFRKSMNIFFCHLEILIYERTLKFTKIHRKRILSMLLHLK